MPTARELLEQADALMRRNRAQVDDDIPVLTDAVPSAQEARSHFAPRVRQAIDAPLPPAIADEVPVLTDVVEEIEAAALVPAIEEGEPSDWLDFEKGEPSVIGDAPDSIAIVPPVDLRRPEPAPDIDEFDGLDEELAAAIAAAPREEESLQPTPPRVELQPEPELDPELEAEPEAPPASVVEAPPLAPPVFAGGAAALLHAGAIPSAVLAAPVTVLPVEALPLALATPVTVLPVEALPPALPLAMEIPVETAPITAPALPDTAPVEGDDSAHWEAMAEEIRMQVLQRIDLFTDTGLRTQLGERLQPIVDRASADLVATINSHVGELLRAYVAEAIEREIESWRKNH